MVGVLGATASALLLLVGSATAQSSSSQNQLETPRLTERDQRLEFIQNNAEKAFKFRFADASGNARVESEAALQLQVDKAGNPFLSTLPGPGEAQFLTVIKPCGILLPHTHQRATEFYTVLSGKMGAGIAQENGGLQNITFDVNPGEVFVAPQGLLHFNANQQCNALAFTQTFNSADPGALNVIGALAALGDVAGIGEQAIIASTADGVQASPQKAFALDKACLKRCKLPATGAPGDGLDTLPRVIKELFGIRSIRSFENPVEPPAAAPIAAGPGLDISVAPSPSA